MRFRRDKDLEAVLRANRPEPSEELVRTLSARTRRAPAPRSRFQLAFAGALSAAVLGALAAVGGISYAATAASDVVRAVRAIVAPGAHHAVFTVSGLTAGGDQYRPGFGFGDPHHIHTGPPGLKKKAPTKVRVLANGDALVSTAILVDEQAHLTINVIGPDGKEIVLDQNTSKIGRGVSGPKTKAIQYLLLIPRTIPVDVQLPAGSFVPGATYRIRLRARSPLNAVAFLFIPFRP